MDSGDDDEMDGDDDDIDGDDEMDSKDEGMGFMEGRRMTREYVEKVNHNYGGSTQKQQGQYAGAGTGDRQSAPKEGTSPISSGKGKPVTGAHSSNIAQGGRGEDQDGNSPRGKAGGLVGTVKGEFTGSEWKQNSAPGAKTKGYSKKESGWPSNGKTAGPVGSGSGEKAGQTSVSANKPFLKKL